VKKLILASFTASSLIVAQGFAQSSSDSSQTTTTVRDGNKTRTDSVATNSKTYPDGAERSTTTESTTKTKKKHGKVKSSTSSNTSSSSTPPPQ